MKKQRNAGAPADLNAIKTDSFSGLKYYSKIILARATTIRAYVFSRYL